MQIRRVLLLFALVLGLSALVASIAPPPEDLDEDAAPATVAEPPPGAEPPVGNVLLSARGAGEGSPPIRGIPAGSSFTLEVRVAEPGDVVIEGLGLRQSADPLAPARFSLLAEPPGRYAVSFAPVGGERREIGRLQFEEPATVTPPRRDR